MQRQFDRRSSAYRRCTPRGQAARRQQTAALFPTGAACTRERRSGNHQIEWPPYARDWRRHHRQNAEAKQPQMLTDGHGCNRAERETQVLRRDSCFGSLANWGLGAKESGQAHSSRAPTRQRKGLPTKGTKGAKGAKERQREPQVHIREHKFRKRPESAIGSHVQPCSPMV
jgi:hypothetical protein